jgi:hypothetical protein
MRARWPLVARAQQAAMPVIEERARHFLTRLCPGPDTVCTYAVLSTGLDPSVGLERGSAPPRKVSSGGSRRVVFHDNPVKDTVPLATLHTSVAHCRHSFKTLDNDRERFQRIGLGPGESCAKSSPARL